MTNASQGLDSLSARVLRALFELARLDAHAQVGLVSGALGVRSTAVARALVQLDARGLARAEQARLTLLGLAVAARLPALALASPTRQVDRMRPSRLRGHPSARSLRGERAHSTVPSRHPGQ